MNGMQNKTIRRKIRAKIEDWAASIEDEDLRKIVFKDAIVTGGSIASMIMGERVNDYDVYMRTKESAIAVGNYYAKVFMESNPGYDIKVEVVDMPNILGQVETRVYMRVGSSGLANDEEFNIRESEDDECEQSEENDELESVKGKYIPAFISDNAITLTNKIQVIPRS